MLQSWSPLPASPQEVRARGWDRLDVLLLSGDAYVDHVSFGVAVVAAVIGVWGLVTFFARSAQH